jgi:hypothetical protein
MRLGGIHDDGDPWDVSPRDKTMLRLRVNYLCTCIAINLALTICFGINPIQKSRQAR